MFGKFLLPLLALIGVGFAVFAIVRGNRTIPSATQDGALPPAPYSSFVAGSGIVEASSYNIAIGAPIAGIVSHIDASVGGKVKAGDPLFRIDDHVQQAELAVRRAAVQVAEAQLANAQYEFNLDKSLNADAIVSVRESSKDRYAVQKAEAQLVYAQAELKAGEVNLDRLIVRAPVDGEVLQLNVRVGEYAMTDNVQQPLILFGSVSPLHVRTNVDENDAWRIPAGAAAIGRLRGNRTITTPLQFVRFEPYVVPKQSLTGDSAERVDTRVLQVIFRFDRGDLPIFVGQQMDVVIEAHDRAAPTAEALSLQ